MILIVGSGNIAHHLKNFFSAHPHSILLFSSNEICKKIQGKSFLNNIHVIVWTERRSRKLSLDKYLQNVERLIQEITLAGKPLIFLSSVAVYKGTVDDPYIAEKINIENMIAKYTDRHIILRLPNIYGPLIVPTKKIGMLSLILNQLREYAPQQLVVDGVFFEIRNFIHIKELADFLKHLVVRCSSSMPKNEVVDVTSDKDWTYAEIVDLLGQKYFLNILLTEETQDIDRFNGGSKKINPRNASTTVVLKDGILETIEDAAICDTHWF